MVSKLKKAVTDSRGLALLAGFVGAAGPSIAAFIAMMKSPTESFEWPHLNFYIGMIAVGLIGAFFIAITKESNGYKALMAGAGAPTLLSSAGTVAVSVAYLMSPVSVAYAEPAQQSVKDSITLTVITQDKVHVIVGNQMFRTKDTLTITIPRGPVEIEHGDEVIHYNPPKDKDSVTVRVYIDKKRGRKHFFKGMFPMMQKFGKKKTPAKNIQLIEENTPAPQEQDQVQEEK